MRRASLTGTRRTPAGRLATPHAIDQAATSNGVTFGNHHHTDTANGRTWYTIRNHTTPTGPHGATTSGGTAVIDIYGEIGMWGIEAAQFVADLRQVTADRIEVHLNSPGGDVYEGIAIYQALVSHPAPVEMRIDGLAASIASIIAQAGNRIVIGANAQVMIHDAWALTVGNAADHRRAADDLDRHSDNLADIYATRTGRGTARSWRKAMEAETWYSADEAVQAGLADEVHTVGARGDDPAAQWRQELAGCRHPRGRADAPAPDIPLAAGGIIGPDGLILVGEHGCDHVAPAPAGGAQDSAGGADKGPDPAPANTPGSAPAAVHLNIDGDVDGLADAIRDQLHPAPADAPAPAVEGTAVLAALVALVTPHPEPAATGEQVLAGLAHAAATIGPTIPTAEAVAAAVGAAIQAPGPVPAPPDPTPGPDHTDHIRRAFLEVLVP